MHLAKKYSWKEDLEIDNETEFTPTFRGSMMFIFDLICMFCISIFNHEGRPFMQSLTEKTTQIKIILSPLFLCLMLSLDISDDLNQMFSISLDSEKKDVIYFSLYLGSGNFLCLVCYYDHIVLWLD